MQKPALQIPNLKTPQLKTLGLITCGSVDDGKSTLLGRLLYDSGAVFADQIDTLKNDSKRFGTVGGSTAVDFALLLDGLADEREQGITIDIAWRYFTTQTHRFIIGDCPGHVEYTRNMAVAASTADCAIILIDATHGLRPQTHHHATIASLMGVRHSILAINKMDRVGYKKSVFHGIKNDFIAGTKHLDFDSITPIPLSALGGDMVVERGENLGWYEGATLIESLESATTKHDQIDSPLRMTVQFVSRPHSDFRGYAGRINAGTMRIGEAVRILPNGTTSTIETIRIGEQKRQSASAGASVMLTLTDAVSVNRGAVIASLDTPPQIADQFEVDIIWLGHSEGIAGRQWLFKFDSTTAIGTITKIKYRLDTETGNRIATNILGFNDIARATISLSRKVVFDAYKDNRTMGGFIIIDSDSGDTVAAGMIDFALRRASTIHPQSLTIQRQHREAMNNQRGAVYWFTGLSGSGKSTIANAFEVALNAQGFRTYLLDGDNIRGGLNRDLGFTDADRVENIRRVAEVARLMLDAGLVVLVAFISPFQTDRAMAKDIIGADRFTEVFVDTPLEICEQRDPKGLYKKARAGLIPNFTGISSPYQPPLNPQCHLTPHNTDLEKIVATLLAHHRASTD